MNVVRRELIHTRRDILEPSRHKRSQLQKYRYKWWLIGLMIIFIAVLFVVWRPWWRISQVLVTGTDNASAVALKETTVKLLAGRTGFIFPKNQVLWYPRQTIINQLLVQDPRLASVEANVEGGTRLRLTVSQRLPFARWCEMVTSQCFILDADGIAFQVDNLTNPATNSLVQLKSQASYLPTLNTQVFSRQMIESVVAWRNALGAVVGGVVGTSRLSRDYVEQEVLVGNNQITIKVNWHDEPGVIKERIATALTASLINQKIQSGNSIQSIDGRHGPKVFITFN